MSTPHAATTEARGATVRLAALWFGLLGGPVAWTLQLLIDYPLVAHYCFPDAARRTEPTLISLHLIVSIISFVALTMAVLALLTALYGWRAAGGSFGEERAGLTEAPPPLGRVRFMAFGGILASALTIIGILFHTGFVLMLPPCR